MDIIDKAEMGKMLRETAALVERGLVRVERIDINYETQEAGYSTLGRELFHTGYQSVTLVLGGNPSHMRAAGFEQPAIGHSPALLER